MNSARFVIWLSDVDTESEYFGSLTKQNARLIQAKFPILPGFVITTHAYQDFLKINGLEHKIGQLLSTISFDRPESLMQAEFHIKQLFRQALISNDFYDELVNFYLQLESDALLEMHEIGKRGRKHTEKIVTSEEGLISEVVQLWTEMFTGKALWHRHHGEVNHFDNKAEIIVQKQISGETKSGIVRTIDLITHAKDKIIIVTKHPHIEDTYTLSKKNLTILDRHLRHKHLEEKLTLDEIHAIAKLAKRVEEYLYFPQEITWILADNKLYIQMIKPISNLIPSQREKKRRLPIARGKGLTSFIGTGQISKNKPDNIIIVTNINAQQIKKLKKIKGLIIENIPNAETSMFIRQRGIPAICNVKNATKRFRDGTIVSIHGEKGEIYLGGFI